MKLRFALSPVDIEGLVCLKKEFGAKTVSESRNQGECSSVVYEIEVDEMWFSDDDGDLLELKGIIAHEDSPSDLR